ncbi:MAG: type IX secretion system membrane protein PorP/SprF [Candidatus Competibacteraceae bacterium]|nr:type IX secretion system membrane protein PorP/SprF [Candidatus Competibacteraceae bacterium]
MRKIYLTILVFIAGLFWSNKVYSQDPQFTQFYANPLYLNPAFAGSIRCPRVALNTRIQWSGISGNYRTYAASYDMHIDPIQGGIGIRMYRDEAGQATITSHNVAVMYSYMLKLSRKVSMRFGAEVGFMQRSLDTRNLTFGDMIDDRYGFIYATQEVFDNDNKFMFDMGAGVIAYSDMFYGGVSFHHITQPNEGFLGNSKLPFKFTAHFGAMIPINSKKKYSSDAFISPNVLFQLQQSFYQVNVGLYAGKGPFVGGIWYRSNDSFIALVGIQKGIFRIGYSYDITISRLTNATAGSHEVSLGLQFGCRQPRKKFRTVKCPSF